MLIVLTQLHRIGSTDCTQRAIAVDPDSVRRLVPDNDAGEIPTVRATFDDGETLILVGTIGEVVEVVNEPYMTAGQ